MDFFIVENSLLAFGLTLFAGLATGIGSLVVFLDRQLSARFLASCLSFSAGVMLYVSFIEIFPKAQDALAAGHSQKGAYALTTLAFFGGILLIAGLERFLPHVEEDTTEGKSANANKEQMIALKRMGIFAAIALAIHNFPEGIATFMSTLQSPQLGFSIALAVALHNIPEGIAVAVPLYFATQSRAKAFFFSFLSGLAEPIGALLAYTVLRPFLNDTLFGFIFAMVAGIMVYLSLAQLLPTALKNGSSRNVQLSLLAGMGLMALSLVLLA